MDKLELHIAGLYEIKKIMFGNLDKALLPSKISYLKDNTIKIRPQHSGYKDVVIILKQGAIPIYKVGKISYNMCMEYGWLFKEMYVGE